MSDSNPTRTSIAGGTLNDAFALGCSSLEEDPAW